MLMTQHWGEKLEVTTTDDPKMIHDLKSGIHELTNYFNHKFFLKMLKDNLMN